jgi:hypothetical protein
MYKILDADKDTYITNKVIRGSYMYDSNVGSAGTLDLFKLYGASSTGGVPNTELTRVLIHFDLTTLKSLVSQGKISPDDPSFWCKIHLKDVYGGQPCPSNFTISIFPLSSSFEEGLGKDVSFYSDKDVSNWLTSSSGNPWYVTGSGLGCFSTGSGDFITSSMSLASTETTQYFKTGYEDLTIDVTPLVSATLSGELPDSGFRISFENTLEVDSQTYFVKRFASRTAYDESKRPKMIVGFDDSITDDSENLTFDTPCKITLYNAAGGSLSNILSGSSLTPLVGVNCLSLKLTMDTPSGSYDMVFPASQFSYGTSNTNFVTGTYQSVVTIPSSDALVAAALKTSSSINFTPTWVTNDELVAFVTGSVLTARQPSRKSSRSLNNFVVSVMGVRESYIKGSTGLVRINIQDYTTPYIKVVRLPVELPGVVLKNVYYQIRDAVTSEVVVPFDEVTNSTRVSSDSNGMFFELDTSSLGAGKTYSIDVMVSHDSNKTRFLNVSPVFRVDRSED